MSAAAADAPAQFLDESLGKTREIAQAVQSFTKQQEDYDRRLSKELKYHASTKERMTALETDHSALTEQLESERKEHNLAKATLDETEKKNVKAQESLKGLADDLVSTRLQNESLRAEMELQRKAFVVSVNWAARHAEMKAKTEDIQQDIEKIHEQISKAKEETDVANKSEEQFKQMCETAKNDLETARAELRTIREQCGDMDSQEDFTAKKLEMENIKAQIAKDAERQKMNNAKTRAALQKSLLAGDQALVMVTFAGWRDDAKHSKLQKAKKSQSQNLAMRGIANTDSAVMDFCITAWYKILQEVKVAKAASDKAAQENIASATIAGANKKVIAQLEKHFGAQSQGLLREVVAAWQEVRHFRLKGEKQKAIIARTIASGGTALILQVFQGWAKVNEENKLNRKRKAASNAKAMRMIANGANAMMDFCLTAWHELTKKEKAVKRSKQGSQEKAARLIANKGSTLLKQIMHEWFQRALLRREKKKKMKAVERNLVNSAEQLVAMIFTNWKAWQEQQHALHAAKTRNMKCAEKALQGNAQVLLQQVFFALIREKDMAKTERYRNALDSCQGSGIDEEGLIATRVELAELQNKKSDLEAQLKYVLGALDEQGALLEDENQKLALRETDLSRVKKEIQDTVKKACMINEELSKVGQFLATWGGPQKGGGGGRVKRAGSERSENSLPQINGSSSRPLSGKSRGPGPATAAWD